MNAVAPGLAQVDVDGAGDGAAVAHAEVAGEIVDVVEQRVGKHRGESAEVIELRHLGAGEEDAVSVGLPPRTMSRPELNGARADAGQVLDGAQRSPIGARHLEQLLGGERLRG